MPSHCAVRRDSGRAQTIPPPCRINGSPGD
jgi:hypothetical protein